jgi:hypothetical protein
MGTGCDTDQWHFGGGACLREVRHPNDEARATLMIEEHDKDKAVAASRVNLKMKQGIETVKQDISTIRAMRAAPPTPEAGRVEEPSFEPGESMLNMRVVGKLRFK